MITAKIITKSDISQDELEVSGNNIEMSMLISLIDPKNILKPKISGAKLGKIISSPPKSITISLGNEDIDKNVLLAFLNFAEIK